MAFVYYQKNEFDVYTVVNPRSLKRAVYRDTTTGPPLLAQLNVTSPERGTRGLAATSPRLGPISGDSARAPADTTAAPAPPSTGGSFYRAKDTEGLRQIYAQIDQLEKSTVELRQWTRYRELFGWWLGAAVALWCVELVLRRTWLRTLP